VTEIKWISSFGGPFVLMSRSTASLWRGTEGRITHATDDASTDYESACSISGYAGIIHGNSQDIVVLDEGPDDIAWFARGSNSGVFARWLGADSDEQVWDALDSIDVRTFEELPILVRVVEPDLVAFDSALLFSEANGNHLELHLDTGNYRISVLNYSPNVRLSLNLVHLRCDGR
jgi:hypothetical protein